MIMPTRSSDQILNPMRYTGIKYINEHIYIYIRIHVYVFENHVKSMQQSIKVFAEIISLINICMASFLTKFVLLKSCSKNIPIYSIYIYEYIVYIYIYIDKCWAER